MINKEFFAALEQLEKEKGIPVDYMLDRVGQALITAYKRENDGMTDNVYVVPDRQGKDIRMFVRKTVVDDVYEPYEEMTVEEAREYKAGAVLGDVIDIDIPTKSFGRIAAQNVMKGELATGYTVKAASNILDEELFVKEKAASDSLFDMSSATLTDGDYTATVDGQEGPMTVAVTIADGKIASVEVTENKETEAIAGPALEKVPAAIVENNSLDVDGVAGATLSSNRIKKAVAQCLEQAAG